jgi:hypothetical protein
MIRKYWIEFLIIALLQLGFLIFQLSSQSFINDFSSEYIQTAQNFIQDRVIFAGDYQHESDPALYSKIMPGYPVFLSAFSFAKNSYLLVILLQAFLSIASFSLILKIFKLQKPASYMLVAFFIVFPAQFIYANQIVPGILLQFILVLSSYILLLYIHTKRISLLWFFQSLIILSLMILPEYSLYVFPNILLFAIFYFRTKQRLVIISSLIPLISLIIIGSINQQRTGYFHISSNLQSNSAESFTAFIDKSLKDDPGYESYHGDIKNCISEKELKDRRQCIRASSLKIIRKNIPQYLLFKSKSVFSFFTNPGKRDYALLIPKSRLLVNSDSEYLSEDAPEKNLEKANNQGFLLTILIILIITFNIIRLAGFLGYLLNRSVRFEFRLFLLFLIGSIALQSAVFGSLLALLPLVLFLSGGSAFQYVYWFRLYSRKRALQNQQI